MKAYFPKRFVFLPVVHCRDIQQASSQVHSAVSAGADGVWLIENLSVAPQLIHEFPDLWIGINDLRPLPAFRHLEQYRGVSGYWSDYAGVDNLDFNDEPWLQKQLNDRRDNYPNIVYFGGVAFKYQEQPEDLAKAVTTALKYVDVITTSGPATGKPPELSKIREMRQTMGADGDLAVASGLDLGNIAKVAEAGANIFMVSTGVSDDWYTFNFTRLNAMGNIIKSLNEQWDYKKPKN